jgi:hypothetical protein
MWIWKQTGIIAIKATFNYHKKRGATPSFYFLKYQEKKVDKLGMMIYNIVINKKQKTEN